MKHEKRETQNRELKRIVTKYESQIENLFKALDSLQEQNVKLSRDLDAALRVIELKQ